MPVRSLHSSVLKWPDAQSVDRAARRWAKAMLRSRKDVLKIAYFGSYARGNWGVGSDLDLIVIVENSEKPFISRAAEWDVTALPVPADVLVYTQQEWDALAKQSRFAQTVRKEAVWVIKKSEE